MGKEVEILDGTGRTIEQCIEDGAHREGQPVFANIDIGYGETTEAVREKIKQIEGVKDASLNAIYVEEDFSQSTLNDTYSFAQVDYFNSINLDFAWKSLVCDYVSFRSMYSGLYMDYSRNYYPAPIAATSSMAPVRIWKSLLEENSIFISYSDEYEDVVVSRSTSPNGPFTGIALVKNGFYTDKTAVKGVQYYYNAFACRYVNGEFYYSGYSDILPMTFH